MAKIICYGEEARKALEKGVDQLAEPSPRRSSWRTPLRTWAPSW